MTPTTRNGLGRGPKRTARGEVPEQNRLLVRSLPIIPLTTNFPFYNSP